MLSTLFKAFVEMHAIYMLSDHKLDKQPIYFNIHNTIHTCIWTTWFWISLSSKTNSVYVDYNKSIKETFLISNNTVLANQLMNFYGNIVILFASFNHNLILLTEVGMFYSYSSFKRWFLWITSDPGSNDYDKKFNKILYSLSWLVYLITLFAFVALYSLVVVQNNYHSLPMCKNYMAHLLTLMKLIPKLTLCLFAYNY